jgi:hypothetical protein
MLKTDNTRRKKAGRYWQPGEKRKGTGEGQVEQAKQEGRRKKEHQEREGN